MRNLRPACLLISALLFLPPLLAQSTPSITHITIISSWRGLGAPQDAVLSIARDKNKFISEGKIISPALINELLASLRAPLLPKPTAANLGITAQWLNEQLPLQNPTTYNQQSGLPPDEMAIFQNHFTDIKIIDRALQTVYKDWHTDDFPGVTVELKFSDGTTLSASSRSQNTFMLPWSVGGNNNLTYNLRISRAVSALMPDKAVNKSRLIQNDLPRQLTDALIPDVENEWNRRNVEAKLADAVAALKTKYTIDSVQITPAPEPEYGVDRTQKDPNITNLHAILRKPSFPKNLAVDLNLNIVDNHAEGLQQFLDSSAQYENLLQSIPWLNNYIRENPLVQFRIAYHNSASLDPPSLRAFTKDMNALHHADLADKATAQQSNILLLLTGNLDYGGYWLLFPDKSMALWHARGESGLFNWSEKKLNGLPCPYYEIYDGFCSGRQLNPDGTLVP